MTALYIENRGDYIEFEHTDKLLYVTKILGFTDNLDNSVVDRKFKWSTDKKSWSSWTSMTNKNLQNIKPIINEPVILKFQYTSKSDINVTITNVNITYTQEAHNNNNNVPTTYTTDSSMCCITKGTAKGLIINNQCQNTFNPYNVNPAIDVYQDIMISVNNQFGITTQYFRAVPDKNSEDVIFMEQTLFGVESCKNVKIMVPDNTFPDSVIEYNQWGIDFEQPFEIHIVKEYFEQIYGVNTLPQKRDIIYIPMANRIYDVVSSYIFKDFMNRDAYWKVGLRKHQEKSNVYKQEDTQDLIDELTSSTEEIMGHAITSDLQDITNNQQTSTVISYDTVDPTRKMINKKLVISNNRIENNATIIAEQYYQHNKSINLNMDVDNIEYYDKVKFPMDTEMAFTNWIKHGESNYKLPSDRVSPINLIDNVYTFSLMTSRGYKIGDEIMLYKGDISLYGVCTNINGNIFSIEIPEFIIDDLSSFDTAWYTRVDWICTKNDEKILLNGLYDGRGIKIGIKAKRFFYVILNNEVYNSSIPTMIENKWYGVVYNISKKYKEISINVWEINNDTNNTDLKILKEMIISDVVNEDTTNDEIRYKIPASTLLQTNIRLFNTVIPYEDQSLVLNQNIIKDSSKAIIIDNAIINNTVPFFGSSK